MTIVSLFGRPGAGKTTVGDSLAEQYGFAHLPLGNMLKDLNVLAAVGINPDEMRTAIETGRTITNDRIYPWLNTRICEASSVVVDGYPRAANSLTPYSALVSALSKRRRFVALYLDCPTGYTHRRVALRGRSDDDDRVVARDAEFETVQLPLLDRLPIAVKVMKVNAARDQAAVFADVERALGLLRTGCGSE